MNHIDLLIKKQNIEDIKIYASFCYPDRQKPFPHKTLLGFVKEDGNIIYLNCIAESKTEDFFFPSRRFTTCMNLSVVSVEPCPSPKDINRRKLLENNIPIVEKIQYNAYCETDSTRSKMFDLKSLFNKIRRRN